MNELYHHGIKGQKWGVRRYQNKDGTLTNAGKNKIHKYTSKYKQEDFNLKKGTEFQRVGAKNEIDNNKRTYVSFTKKDNLQYLKYSDSLEAFNKIKLNSIKDIKIAKGKVLVDTFIEQIGDKNLSDIIDAYHTPEYNLRGIETKQSKLNKKELAKTYKNVMKNEKSFDKAFERFSGDLMKDNAMSNEYYRRLKSKGYDGMYDYNDREAADNPLIIFDRKNSLKTKNISEISRKEIDEAITYLRRNFRS